MSDLITYAKVKHAVFLKNALLTLMQEASFLRRGTLGHNGASEKMYILSSERIVSGLLHRLTWCYLFTFFVVVSVVCGCQKKHG